VTTAPDPAISSALGLATATLDAHNYRAALTYARQVLALDPSNAVATKVRADAVAALARFDEAIADARKRISAGDVQGATQSLDTARGIDPSSPSVAEVASQISELSRAREPVPAARADRQNAPARQGTAPVRGTPAPARATPPPAATSTSMPQASPPRAEPPSAPPPASTSAAPLPSPPAAAPTTEAPPAAKPAPAPPVTAAENKPPPRPQGPSAEEDEAAIRQVTATYARAIEAKDITLFRSIKPNLSREEERRLQDGFRAVTSQRVDLTIVSIDRRGDEATVVLRRRDTIQAGGRTHTAESRQTIMLARTPAGWKVTDIR
jgi:ketosteroid isomerase-like protein